jgi:hypothetical protein
MKNKNTNKNILTWLPVITPLMWLFLYISLAIHCRLVVGHWPEPIIENVNILSYNIHETLIYILMYIVFLSIPAWFIMLFFKNLRITLKIHLIQITAFVLGILLIALFFKFDSTPFTEWFLD